MWTDSSDQKRSVHQGYGHRGNEYQCTGHQDNDHSGLLPTASPSKPWRAPLLLGPEDLYCCCKDSEAPKPRSSLVYLPQALSRAPLHPYQSAKWYREDKVRDRQGLPLPTPSPSVALSCSSYFKQRHSPYGQIPGNILLAHFNIDEASFHAAESSIAASHSWVHS